MAGRDDAAPGTDDAAVRRARRAAGTDAALRVLAVLALGYSAYVHWHVRHDYDVNRTSVLSEGTVFVLQAVACLAASVLLLSAAMARVTGRPGWHLTVGSWLLALAVAAGSSTGVVLYRYVDVGRIGVLPDMYEPAWFPLKTASAVADAVATASALAALALLARHPGARPCRTRSPRRTVGR